MRKFNRTRTKKVKNPKLLNPILSHAFFDLRLPHREPIPIATNIEEAVPASTKASGLSEVKLNSVKMDKRKQGNKKQETSAYMDMKSTRMELKSILKDIEYMGPSHMTWKQKKALENKKVVSLGGKPPKKQRLPLSVARVAMKKQKERDQKMLQENILLGQVGGKRGNRSKQASVSHKPEDRVLMSTAGQFRNGILDVKDLLKSNGASSDRGGSRSHGFSGGSSSHGFGSGSGGLGFGGDKGGKKKGGKKNGGKKGGRRKGH
ncbi:hypothetical protein L1987_10668 [Smallanthus sonchifolius]|uniref:Uncharacterized protein n=1 Tax=Smallanthus sonchifolius TaxID=185202 RepID=A0ACB9J991_9ASTR|nr:hypothetical protein L1987_10668 [Smallanthus sonchifolius]